LVNGLKKEAAQSLLPYVHCVTFKQIVIFLVFSVWWNVLWSGVD